MKGVINLSTGGSDSVGGYSSVDMLLVGCLCTLSMLCTLIDGVGGLFESSHTPQPQSGGGQRYLGGRQEEGTERVMGTGCNIFGRDKKVGVAVGAMLKPHLSYIPRYFSFIFSFFFTFLFFSCGEGSEVSGVFLPT